MKTALLMTLNSKILMTWILIANAVISISTDESGLEYAKSVIINFALITFINFVILRVAQRKQ